MPRRRDVDDQQNLLGLGRTRISVQKLNQIIVAEFLDHDHSCRRHFTMFRYRTRNVWWILDDNNFPSARTTTRKYTVASAIYDQCWFDTSATW